MREFMDGDTYLIGMGIILALCVALVVYALWGAFKDSQGEIQNREEWWRE